MARGTFIDGAWEGVSPLMSNFEETSACRGVSSNGSVIGRPPRIRGE